MTNDTLCIKNTFTLYSWRNVSVGEGAVASWGSVSFGVFCVLFGFDFVVLFPVLLEHVSVRFYIKQTYLFQQRLIRPCDER